MIRRQKKLVAILIMGSLFLFFSIKVISGVIQKRNVRDQVFLVPEFRFFSIQHSLFSNKNLNHNKPIVFLYFNTSCNFCHDEALSIRERKNQFRRIQVIFVSTESINSINDFAKKYSLNGEDNIFFLYDSLGDFANLFHTTSIPSAILYDRDHHFIGQFKGPLSGKGILDIFDKHSSGY